MVTAQARHREPNAFSEVCQARFLGKSGEEPWRRIALLHIYLYPCQFSGANISGSLFQLRVEGNRRVGTGCLQAISNNLCQFYERKKWEQSAPTGTVSMTTFPKPKCTLTSSYE